MFCPNCGTNHPDGILFCDKCGTSINAKQTTFSNSHATPANPLSKKAYLSQKATPKTKTTAKLVLALTILSLVTMMIGHITLLNTSLDKMSIFQIGNINESFVEMKTDISDTADYYAETFTFFKDSISEKDQSIVEDYIKVMQSCGDNLSISNMTKMAKVTEKLATSDIAEDFDLSRDIDELKESAKALKGFSKGLLISAVIFWLFTIIGGLCRVRGLVIAGMIFSTIYCFVIYGIIIAILNVIIHIAIIKFLGDVNKEYKSYRNGTLRPF